MTIESIYLRFKWINWNRSCNTAADLVTQTNTPLSVATAADAGGSGLVLQPPLPLRRSPRYACADCTRAICGRRAMGAGAHGSATAAGREVAA